MFKAALVEVALVNFLLAYIVQVTMATAVGWGAVCISGTCLLQAYVLETLWYRQLLERLWQRLRKERSLSEHRRISKALETDTSWPPLVDAHGQ